MNSGSLTTSELICIATESGYSVTPRQLERWRENGLLPRPDVIHLGKGKGVRSEYPPSAGPQLVALCRIHFGKKEKRLPRIRFALWLEGYSVPLAELKKSFECIVLNPLNKLIRSVPGEGAGGKADALAEKMTNLSPRTKFTRRMKRNASDPQDWLSLLTIAFQLFLTRNEEEAPLFNAYNSNPYKKEKSLPDIFIDALCLRRAQTDRIGDTPPWLSVDVGKLLNTMSEGLLLSASDWGIILSEATMDQLEQARDYAKVLADVFPQVVKRLEPPFGAGAFGLSMFSELSGHDLHGRAFLILGILSFRLNNLAEGIDEMCKTISQLQGAHTPRHSDA